MIRIFFDTEFTGLHPDALLISIGLVSEDGRTFYAELSDGDAWHYEKASDFAKIEVLPLLEGGECVMQPDELRQRLAAWLTDFMEPVQLATDSLAWDWLWIRRLFPTPDDWPANVDPDPLLLNMNYIENYDDFCEAHEHVFAEAGLRRHHALDDAQAHRLSWFASLKQAPPDYALAQAKQNRAHVGHLPWDKAKTTVEYQDVDFDEPIVRVSLVDGRLTVALPDGEPLAVDTDHARDLADALFARGFDSDHVHCVDWRESDGIGVGHAIAIKSRLRELANTNSITK